MEYGIHWFRRDLRVLANPALQSLYRKFDGQVLGLFCFDSNFLGRHDFSHNRFQFFLQTLVVLKRELSELGSDLLVWDRNPHQAYPDLFQLMNQHQVPLPRLVGWNRDYEPFSSYRDPIVTEAIEQFQVGTHVERDHLLIEPEELEKEEGGGYKVFTPFSKKWKALMVQDFVRQRLAATQKAISQLQRGPDRKKTPIFDLTWSQLFSGKMPLKDSLKDFCRTNSQKVTVPIPPAGTDQAFARLQDFQSKISHYKQNRDLPSLEGTSKLSLYLKNGSISSSMVIEYLKLGEPHRLNQSQSTFLNEIIWREFYFHLIHRNPRVEKEAFQRHYRRLKWKNDVNLFQAWERGQTGFPIVDAGMRQLHQTGWMHNRVRMIVASFLVKDLLIDWRWGEKLFMKKLLDGDLAANNGGWQWAASTGCDAQPYFRIFNPWLQGLRFDKEGQYIKKYIPELRLLKASQLHKPILDHPTYPAPIVDHSIQRKEALDLFKKSKNQKNESPKNARS